MRVVEFVRELDEGDGVHYEELLDHVTEDRLRAALKRGDVYPVGDRIKATRREPGPTDE